MFLKSSSGLHRFHFPQRPALLSVLLIFSLLLTGCSNKNTLSGNTETAGYADGGTDSGESDGNTDDNAGTVPETETLEFTDAIGGTHTLIIDPDAAMNDYDVSLFAREYMKVSYTDSTAYSYRLGVDVSYYQGDIDWESVYADGYTFAFIRIGFRGYGAEGTLVEDEMFQTNLAEARSAGLDVGVYFYAQAVSEEEAAEEAAFVLNILDETRLDLPVIYDPEYVLDSAGSRLEDARTSELDGSQMTQNTLVFCETIRQAGYEAGFYSSMLSESEVFDMSELTGYTVWYADYNDTPQTPYAFTFWQYSENGIVSGIQGDVDLNIQLIPAS